MRRHYWSVSGSICTMVATLLWVLALISITSGNPLLPAVFIVAALLAGIFATLIRIALILEARVETPEKAGRFDPDRSYDHAKTPPRLTAVVRDRPEKTQETKPKPATPTDLQPTRTPREDAIAQAEAEAFRRAAGRDQP